MRTLEGSVVVVTGAGRGIGRAIAEELGRGGAKVVVNYSKSKGAAEETVESLLNNGAQGAIAMQADVSKVDQAQKLIDTAVKEFGRLDVLVNNAGITIDRQIKNMSDEDWSAVIQMNLTSYFYTIKAAQTYMVQQKSGTIVNISSYIGQSGGFGQANYGAAKAGVLGLTKVAAIELARYNITVNALAPGYTDTDMFVGVPDKVKQTIVSKIPLGRFATPQEIARGVRFLVVDAEYMTGQTLSMNGGILMQ